MRALVDETLPLPPGVSFFEQRYTPAMFVQRIGIGLVLLLVAAALILFSLEFLYEYDRHIDPKYREYFNLKAFVAGAAFAYAGWLMLSSMGAGRALMRRQAAGERTRHGIFLTREALVSQSQFDTTVIPRERFVRLDGGKVFYVRVDGEAPRSFALPAEWIGFSPQDVAQAVTLWSRDGPSAAPPLPA